MPTCALYWQCTAAAAALGSVCQSVSGDCFRTAYGQTLVHVRGAAILARSAELPTGLYILPSVISSFFTMSKVSVSTGPIFTLFSPNGRYLREFS